MDKEFFKGLGRSAVDVGAAVGSSLIAEPVAGLGGLVELARGKGSAKAADRVRALRERLTYVPREDAGQRSLELIGKPFELLDEHILQPVADSADDLAGPAAGAGVYAVLNTLAPGKKVKGGRALDALEADVQKKSVSTKRGQSEKVDKTSDKAPKRIVGAPAGVDTPAKEAALRASLKANVLKAQEGGIEPGWFYEKGRTAISSRARDADTAEAYAKGLGITSSEAPVFSNVVWTNRGLEQLDAGQPVKTGMYPNAEAATKQGAFDGSAKFSDLGLKRGEYARSLLTEKGLGANDRWEQRAFGYPNEQLSPQRDAYMHKQRQQVADEMGLSPQQVQELNWATVRTPEGETARFSPEKDTIQGAMHESEFQHSWESRPGRKTGHLPELYETNDPAVLAQLHEDIKGAVVDPNTGRDILVDAFGGGGRMQSPVIDTPGVYEGRISPSSQSFSQVPHTGSGGIDPLAKARIRSTELLRGWATAQDAVAGHLDSQGLRKFKPDTQRLDLGRTITPEEAALLEKQGGGFAVVGTREGANVLGAAKPDAVQGLFPGAKVTPTENVGGGFYEDINWGDRKATEQMLGALDDPQRPISATQADSTAVREVMGRIADVYEKYAAQGMAAREDLTRALRAYQSGGIAAVRELVKKGVAPAIVLVPLMQDEQPTQPES